ncbi:hypothetical protein GGR51DRAFT_573140 [Nemania sp. FL0031]|nr:hypothetical protein GGR51DRAFT_573140 [Nemania sp. FL0031]
MGVTHDWRVDCQGYFDASFGAGYIHFATDRFPELQKLFKIDDSYIWQQSRLSVAEAIVEYEKALSQISSSCKLQDMSKEWYYLTALTTTIIRPIRVLSGIELPVANLYPRRSGVEWLYNQQKLRHQHQRQKAHTHSNPHLGKFVERVINRNPRGDKYALEFFLLAIAAVLFSGEQRMADIKRFTSAVTSYGTCAYYRILTNLSRQAHIAARVRVIPGRVEHNGRLYDAIYDFRFDPFKDSTKNLQPRNIQMRSTGCIPERTRELARQCSAKPLQLALREYLGDTSSPVLEVGLSVNMKDNTEILELCGGNSGISDELDEAIRAAVPDGSPTTEAFKVLKYQDSEVAIF